MWSFRRGHTGVYLSYACNKGRTTQSSVWRGILIDLIELGTVRQKEMMPYEIRLYAGNASTR